MVGETMITTVKKWFYNNNNDEEISFSLRTKVRAQNYQQEHWTVFHVYVDELFGANCTLCIPYSHHTGEHFQAHQCSSLHPFETKKNDKRTTNSARLHFCSTLKLMSRERVMFRTFFLSCLVHALVCCGDLNLDSIMTWVIGIDRIQCLAGFDRVVLAISA